MDKIEQLYPTERPGPLKVGDIVKHADRGLFLVARVNFYSPNKVGLVSLHSGTTLGGPVVMSQGTSIAAGEAVVLLGKLDGWHRLTRDEAAAELALPF